MMGKFAGSLAAQAVSFSFLLALCGLAAAGPDAPAQVAGQDRDVFYFIPHTHWEGAVFKTREEYLEMGLPNILRALELLEAHPNYRFVLDQTCYVQPFLERYPEQAATFQRLVDEGRLAIVGGTLVMPDVNMPSGESFIRQMLVGKRYFRQALGVDVNIGWQLDTFGHHPQMPQLMKLAGYTSFWTQRGVVDPNTPSEFLWEGLDGTRIPTFWLPLSYAVTYGSPNTWPAFAEFFTQRFDALAPFSRGPGRVGLAGADVCEPEPHVPALVERFNREAQAGFELRLAVPADFAAAVAQRPDPPVVHGDFNPIFQGTYSSRIELKQRTRENERLLINAEKLSALLQWLQVPVDDTLIERAWEPTLFNHAHDLMSGVMTDHVYEDTLRGYDFSHRLGTDMENTWRRCVAQAVDTRGDGIPVIVSNLLGWPRTDIVTVSAGWSAPGIEHVGVLDPEGRDVPAQVLREIRSAEGGLLQAELAFVARDVPALGHAVFRLVSGRASAAAPAMATDAPVLENDLYRLEFDAATGALTRLARQSPPWEVLAGPGNVVAREEDQGDLWELYHNLQAGFVTNKTPHGPPQPGQAVLSSEHAGNPGSVSSGPVFSEFQVAHPFGGDNEFATTVRLYRQLRRIEIRTRILNQEQSVRYRVLFPTSIPAGQSYHEIPFGALERPAGIELPAQNWVDYGDGQHGLAVLNRGLPGNNVADGTMLLSLMRSARIQAYGYAGGYEPGMSSDSGFAVGREFTFDYALVPHAGDWRDAEIHRAGLEFNHPLLAATAAVHPGVLPPRWGLLEITPANVVLTALKPGNDGSLVLRCFEAVGRTTSARIRASTPIVSAQAVNLLEDDGATLQPSGSELALELHPFEIKTVRLRLTPPPDPR